MGKYQLVRRLATGGRAEVFLAKAAGPRGFEKELVVKRILPHLAEDPQFVEMFLTEAKLAARLNHGNVVQIFDFGEQEDAYFIAMEYVQGLNLKVLAQRAFQRGSPIPYPLIARIVSLACEGLAYAHELVDPESGQPMGFIHRDISTDNILVSLTGGVKVVDFGIAKAANVGQQTQGGVIKGKMSYMPPEYLKGLSIDSRADIYALGVVLYELIALRKPFVAESEAQLAQLIVHTPAVDVRTLRTDIPAPLVQVVERAMHKDLQSRYASCRQMQADLERFLFQCGEPVGALQISELVKELAAMNASPARRSSTELPAVTVSGASPPSQATRSLRPPSAEPTPPVEDTIVTPPPTTFNLEEDEELMRLVARPRWHWQLAIAAVVLILGGVGALSFSERAHPPSEAGADSSKPQGSHPEQAGPAPAVSPPLPNAQASLVPDAGTPASHEQAPVAPAPDATASSSATLQVTSNFPAQVWLNEQLVGKTPWERRVSPGRKQIEIIGTMKGQRFNKVKTIRFVAGETQEVSFSIERLTVQVRGQPSGMNVISLDGQLLNGQGRVETYEGQHTLKLIQVPSGKIFSAECLATVGDKQCKVVMSP
jgi:serine/threonine-protein kinase